MTQSILQNTLLALSFVILSPTPPSSSSASLVQITPEIKQEFTHRVKEGETLALIAEKYYESPDFWTIVWNDNEQLESPDTIEPGWTLTIRIEKPLFNEELSEVHAKKLTPVVYPTQYSQSISAEYNPKYINPQAVAPTPVTSSAAGPLSDAQIAFLGNCESGMNPTTNTGNGFYGAFQFMIGTWNSMQTGYERADLAPLEVQKDAVQRLLSRSSIFHQFPGCSRKMQLAGLI